MSEEAVPLPNAGPMSVKKLVLFIVLPLILVGAGGAAAWFLVFNPLIGNGDMAMVSAGFGKMSVDPNHPPTYYDLDEMTVNLTSTTKRNSYLKLRVALELQAPEDQEVLPSVLPRIVDQFQIFLRGVKVEDLTGAEGLQRLREELLTRAQKSAEPANVTDVLFKVVQIQ